MSKPSSETRTTSNGVFRLLVPATRPTSPGSPSIKLQGRHWLFTEPEQTPDDANVLDYTCVSYAWGRGTTANPFDERLLMSDRTIPALDATIRTRQPTAIWIDALCVPFQDPAKTVCLRSMGAIYSKALQVVVVLSKSCSNLLEQIYGTGRVDTETLLTLEDDKWVTRAWTYQEVVNSKSLHFIVEKGSDVSVSGDQFLNCVGQAIDEYKNAQGYNSFKLRRRHPQLDSLESLILDWRTADYLKRSAYQVMSAMKLRDSERPEDRFYAMIGAIATTSVDDRDAQPIHPAEYFMRICEDEGDYSFIYSTAPRSEIPGKCWRPVAAPIDAILPWPSDGEGQSGCIQPTHIQLKNMCRMMLGPINPTARQFVEKWLQSDNAVALSGTIPTLILQRLEDAGFSGCKEPLEMESGYFFPQAPITNLDDVFAVVAAEVRWVHGSPGLLVRGNATDIHHYCGVGVFIGPVPQTGHSINIGEAG